MSSVTGLHLAVLCVLHAIALAESEKAPRATKSCNVDSCEVPGLDSVEMYQDYEAKVLDVNLMQMTLARNPEKMSEADGLPKAVPGDAVSEPRSIDNSSAIKAHNDSSVKSKEVDGLSTLASKAHNDSSVKLREVDGLTSSSKAHNDSSVKSKEVDGLTTSSVWISAYARSGSSTLLAMIAAAEGPENGRIFTLYEPSRSATDSSRSATDEENLQFMLRMLQGNFVEGDLLQDAWNAEFLSVDTASQDAKEADLVAVKTITYGHDLQAEALPILELDPRVRLVTIVRDPRAIYASQLATTGDFVEGDAGIAGLCSICDNFARNIDFEHERKHVVLFERMTTEPVTTAQALYSFLGLQFGPKQEKWIDDNFDADCGFWSSLLNFICGLFGKSCTEYTTCSSDSQASNQKWRYSLKDRELQAFQARPTCIRVAEFYGYPTGVVLQEPAPLDLSKAVFQISWIMALLILYVFAGWYRSKRL